jgi:hypothetical protein
MDMTRSWARDTNSSVTSTAAPVVAQIRNIGFWAVAAYLFTLLWFPIWGELKFGGSPNLAPTKLTYYLCLGLWALLLLIKPYGEKLSRPDERSSRWVWYLVHFLFFWQLASVLFIRPELAESITALKSMFPPWLAFCFATSMFRSEKAVKWTIRMIAVGGVIQIALALVEGLILKRHVFLTFLEVTSLGSAFATVETLRDGAYRVKGSFSHPLMLANFLISFGGILLSVGLFGAKGWRRWLLILLSAGMTGILLLTHTRTGLIIGGGFFAGIIILFYWLWSRRLDPLKSTLARAQLIWVGALAAVGAYFAQDLLVGRTSEEIWSSYYRWEQLARVIPAMMDEPLFGYGSGRGSLALATGAKNIFGYGIDNLPVLLAVDYGPIAPVAYVMAYALSMWRLMPRWNEWALTPEIGVRLGFVIYFMSMLVMINVCALRDMAEAQMVIFAVAMAIPGRYTIAKAPRA